MKKTLIGIATATLAITAIPSAVSAAPWQSINARQDRLYQRIDQGVRSGQLNRNEAYRLRSEFAQLNRLERDYRRSGNGLSNRERLDLDRRFDRLAASVHRDRRDRDRRWS